MSNKIYFSKFLVTDQVFFKTKYNYALVNLKPILAGHVLVVPLKNTAISLSQLTPVETQDHFNTVQLVQQFIKWVYTADAMNIAIQDGPEAGQSVPHLHTHIIPRYRVNNIGDEIYERIDQWDWQEHRAEYLNNGGRAARKKSMEDGVPGTGQTQPHSERELKPDNCRTARTQEEMAVECKMLKDKLKEYLEEFPHMRQWILEAEK
ncbi:bis(5'-adenosyl)-triphosphatase KNAG_0M01550 [Huiozyma naganishii CBS 8797]|uniref:Bis(5'-adenosyl)-triphosphatase n=1 Tax=Huiozyma naganishii (strain ATCC MYA-139 / BCRC 22969 / CBS 8797 / KCTC 17520 / NBRC 10181 / NCYC 3082 / Yp74L-3) TaxID=1071383 RepID=J7RSW9_HUIN7|nr:hypothetical protein KNAG_0M01550 [Kazachstania naganishii CBS 8797]CCK73008.1 hypothetical protein KNAG_0M01550 [Kazachstania naganishii CBS 8797]